MTTQPQPVLNNAKISAAFTAAVGLAVTFGVVPQVTKTDVLTAGNAAIGAVLAIVPAIGTILAAIHARNRVTPIDSPKDSTGADLMPTDHVAGVSALIDQLHALVPSFDSAQPAVDDEAQEVLYDVDSTDATDSNSAGYDDADNNGTAEVDGTADIDASALVGELAHIR